MSARLPPPHASSRQRGPPGTADCCAWVLHSRSSTDRCQRYPRCTYSCSQWYWRYFILLSRATFSRVRVGAVARVDLATLRVSARLSTALFGVVLFASGVGYRALFLHQGFNGSDEAFIPALAMRIVRGQVIYRDSIYPSPPLTPYKEAAVAAILGNGYTH